MEKIAKNVVSYGARYGVSAVVLAVLIAIVGVGAWLRFNTPRNASALPQELPMVQHDAGWQPVNKTCCLR